MKTLFIHDHIFIYNNGKYYSTGGLSGDVLKRYIDIFGEVTIIARAVTKDNIDDLNLASIKGTNFIIVPNHKSIKSFHKILKVKKIIKKEVLSSDYIIARLSSIGNIAAVYANRFNKPCLVEVVGCLRDSLWNYNLLGKIISQFVFVKMRSIVKKSKYVIYVTDYFLQKRYPTNGQCLNSSDVIIKDLRESIITSRIEKILSLESHSIIIIGTIGAINIKYKGQENVIKALSILKKQGFLNYQYDLVGGGDTTYLTNIALKYDVLDQVRFIGKLSHDKIYEWLDKIDIYIQPSKTEGMPRALIEAMSRAVPSFGSNVGGIPELLHKDSIFSKNYQTSKRIASLLMNIDKDIMIDMANKNFNRSKAYYHLNIENKWRDFFKKFIEENS